MGVNGTGTQVFICGPSKQQNKDVQEHRHAHDEHDVLHPVRGQEGVIGCFDQVSLLFADAVQEGGWKQERIPTRASLQRRFGLGGGQTRDLHTQGHIEFEFTNKGESAL